MDWLGVGKAASCSALPAHATAAQLLAAGFLPDQTVLSNIIGTLLAVLTPLTFLPATVKMMKMNSTASMSIFTQIANTVQNCWQCAALIGESAPIFAACTLAPAGQCYGNLVPFLQTLTQSLGVLAVGIPYTYLWIRGEVPTEYNKASFQASVQLSRSTHNTPPEDLPAAGEEPLVASILAPPDECACMSHGAQKALLLFHFAATAFVAVWITVLPLAMGACATLVLQSRDVFVAVATLAQFIGPIPQIIFLLRTKDPGALSGAMLLLQAAGSGILVVTFLGTDTSVWAVLPFIGGVFMMSFQFCLWLLYCCRKSRRGEPVVWL